MNLSLTCKKKHAELNHIKEMLTRMEIMGADLAAMEDLKQIYVAIASVPVKNFNGLETALAGMPVFINRCSLAKEAIFVCLASSNKHQADIEKIMRTYHAEIFHIPKSLPHDVNAALKEVTKQLKENSEKEKAVCLSLNKLGNENKDNLASWKETTENILALLNAEKKMGAVWTACNSQGICSSEKIPRTNRKSHWNA